MDQARLKACRLFLFDMDGTLYLGDDLFPFTVDLLAAIRARGGRYLFMTNNSSRSVADYVKKLARLGVEAAEEDFITSSQATALYLQKHHRSDPLYVCGTRSLKEELKRGGLTVTEDAASAACVVMGFDTELTFEKLRDVSWLLLTRPGIPYIATNPDYVCPTEFGSVPDCGSVCDMLYNVAKRRPLVIGKPTAAMPTLAMEKWGISREETVVIGDRIYTDIKSGLNAGCLTLLVMSGETDEAILASSPDKPHFVFPSGKELLELLKSE